MGINTLQDYTASELNLSRPAEKVVLKTYVSKVVSALFFVIIA